MTVKDISPFLDGHTDFLGLRGADALVRHLTDWWHSRGYVGVKFERYQLPGAVGTYGVRSNLRNGLPYRVVLA